MSENRVTNDQIRGIDLAVKATSKVFPFIKSWEFTPDWEKYTTVIYINLRVDFLEVGKFMNMEPKEYWLNRLNSGEEMVSGALLSPFDWGDYGSDKWEEIADVSHNLRQKINNTLTRAYEFIPNNLSITYNFGAFDFENKPTISVDNFIQKL